MAASFDVFGFGNALVDIVIQVDDSHILDFGLKKGNFHIVEGGRMKEILKELDGKERKIVPAGSCANTIFALSSLGADVVLCGKVGNDPHGKLYEEVVLKDSIRSRLKKCPVNPTGLVINLVTPDGERTFAVNLGASVTIQKEEIEDVIDDLASSSIFHTEGYVLENPALRRATLHLIEAAKSKGVRVSLDLSDPGVIERNLSEMKSIVERHADIVFLNEREASVFTGGMDPESAVLDISKACDIAVVKLGENGSLVKRKDSASVVRIEAVRAKAVDTTGAGDFYAAGFLYGLSRNKDLATCGKIGSIIAAKVVQQMGARPPAGMRCLPGLKGLL